MKLSRLLSWAGLTALLIFAVFNYGFINDFIRLVKTSRWYLFVGVIAVQALSYFANAKYYQALLEIQGYRLPVRLLYEVSLGVNFVNQVFPSGGISGTSYFSTALRDRVPIGKSTLTQFLRYVFTFLGMLLILMLGFSMLLLGSPADLITARLILFIMVIIILGSFLMLVLVSDRPRIERVGRILVRAINGFFRRLFKRPKLVKPAQVDQFFDEFYDGMRLLMGNKRAAGRPLAFALLGSLAEISTIYVVVLALGAVVNPGSVIAAYTLANLAGLASVFTGGLGIYEAMMVTILTALGLPLALSLSITILYRGLNLLLFLPIGFHFYRKHL
jgi:uncharacterized protein (TIRG00374 family)